MATLHSTSRHEGDVRRERREGRRVRREERVKSKKRPVRWPARNNPGYSWTKRECDCGSYPRQLG